MKIKITTIKNMEKTIKDINEKIKTIDERIKTIDNKIKAINPNDEIKDITSTDGIKISNTRRILDIKNNLLNISMSKISKNNQLNQ